MSENPTFGQLLVQFRDHIRLSQTRLAHRCYVDHSYISRLESGDRRPNVEFLETLFRNFDVPEATRLAMYSAAGFPDPTYARVLETLPTPVLDFVKLVAEAEQENVDLLGNLEFRGTLSLLAAHVKSLTNRELMSQKSPPRIAYTDSENKLTTK